jgi:hypothetical protein
MNSSEGMINAAAPKETIVATEVIREAGAVAKLVG